MLNDCKYGVNVLGGNIRLTLLKAPIAPDMTADLGTQHFTYAFYAWNGAMATSSLVQEGYDLNMPVATAAGAAEPASLMGVEGHGVLIETVKAAEDGSGDLIVRLYDALGQTARPVLTTSLAVTSAQLTDMLERPQSDLSVADGRIPLAIRPFQVHTVRLKA